MQVEHIERFVTQFEPEEEGDEDFFEFYPGDFEQSPPLAIGEWITLSRSKVVYKGGPNNEDHIRTFEVVGKHSSAEFTASYDGTKEPHELMSLRQAWFTIYTLRAVETKEEVNGR